MDVQQRVSIHATESFTMPSESIEDTYRISVAFPQSYQKAQDRAYPALYVLDGNLLFDIVVGMSRLSALSGSFPELVVIGIGYPLGGLFGQDYRRFRVRRAYELTPEIDERYEALATERYGEAEIQVRTGGAERFRRFLLHELVPIVEERYRLDPEDRVLLGHSLGGLFVLHALFTEPEGFRRYVCGSPSLGVANHAMFAIEERYASKHDALPAALFAGIGDEEERAPTSPAGYHGQLVTVSDFFRFFAVVAERKYQGLRMRRRVFDGYGHTDVFGPIVSAGLRTVFADTTR